MQSSILDHEEIVFNLIQEFINKSRVLNIEKIIPYINNRLSRASININHEGIKKILKSLIEKKKITEGSILTRDDILDNSKRKLIYEFTYENPGVYVSKISKSLKISRQVVAWHLEMLREFGFITQGNFDNKAIFYDSKSDLNDAKKNYILSKEKIQKILFYLQNSEAGLTANQITQSTILHPSTVKKYLNYLEELNVVFQEKDLNKTVYLLND